ncbi:MAG: hypothetical protein C4320_02235 [Armatimonadota bacterium]
MFRKLYWVSEEIDENGKSHVSGVFTSIPNLLQKGFPAKSESLRLNLCKLDACCSPLLTWEAGSFDQVSEQLKPFVETEEFSPEHVAMLQHALDEKSTMHLKK